MSSQELQLENIVENYCAIKGLCPTTRKLYRRSVALYSGHLKRPATVGDFEDLVFSRWLEIRSLEVARETLRGEAAKLLSLWRWCSEPRRAWVLPPEVRSPESYYRVPQSLTHEQLTMLWRYISGLTGRIESVRESTFWLALLGVLWDSAERIGAIRQMHRSDLDGRTLAVYPSQRKGRRKFGRTYKLSRSSSGSLRELIEAAGVEHPFELLTKDALYKRFRRIRLLAGLPGWVTFHTLRRSHASHLTAAGGDARRSLGHSSEGVTDRCYRDPRIADRGSQPSDLLFNPLPWWRRWKWG
jgi:integrase